MASIKRAVIDLLGGNDEDYEAVVGGFSSYIARFNGGSISIDLNRLNEFIKLLDSMVKVVDVKLNRKIVVQIVTGGKPCRDSGGEIIKELTTGRRLNIKSIDVMKYEELLLEALLGVKLDTVETDIELKADYTKTYDKDSLLNNINAIVRSYFGDMVFIRNLLDEMKWSGSSRFILTTKSMFNNIEHIKDIEYVNLLTVRCNDAKTKLDLTSMIQENLLREDEILK